jgi:hypothetical protein
MHQWVTKRFRDFLTCQRHKDPSAYKPQPGRDGADFWPTIDPGLHDMLIHCVMSKIPPETPIWEAAGGSGHLVDPLRRGRQLVIATDLFPDPGRPDIGRLDFLHGEPPPETRGAVMVTNPPNSQLTQFIVRGETLIDTGWLVGMALHPAGSRYDQGPRSGVQSRSLCLEDMLPTLLEAASQGR